MISKARSYRLGATLLVLLLISGGSVYAFSSGALHPAGHGVQGHPLSNTKSHTNHGNDSQTHTDHGNDTHTESENTGQNTTQSGQTGVGTTGTHTSENETSHTHQSETENETSTETSGSSTQTGSTTTGSETESGTSTSTSTSENESQTSSGEGSQSQHELKFRMVPANSSLGTGGNAPGGEANIQVQGTGLRIRLELEHLDSHGNFTLALLLNGTGVSLGNFTSSDEGGAQIDLEHSIATGNYNVGLAVYENSGHSSVLYLVSQPTTLPLAALSGGTASTTSTASEGTEQVTTIHGDSNQEDSINSAIGQGTIPAVVHVSKSGFSLNVVDPKFTVFVGSLQGGGLQITISASNVTSPRVLLVNLTDSQYLNLGSGSLAVTYDGAPVQEASSVTQILTATSATSPMFVLVSTATGYQLLVSIPHFSTHVINILPVIAAAVAELIAADGPALLFSALAITIAFVGIYATRPKILT